MNDDFDQRLRDRADAAVPQIDVDTSRVITRGRRRRAARRGATGLAVAAVVAGGVWGAQAAVPWATSSSLGPAGQEAPAPPADTSSDAPSATSPAPEADDGVPAGSWWYTRSESRDRDGAVELRESWHSREQPGLLVWDGDEATATGVGPHNTLGRFRIDGEWVDQVRDAAMLPTDPDELGDVLHASVEPDVRTGTDDEKVAGMARDLLAEGGLLPAELRHAAWAVLTGLPGVQVGEGQDSTGRTGEVLEYTQDGTPSVLVRDPATGLLLEESIYVGTDHAWSTTYLEQRVADSVPVEPTLENAGCVAWETC